MLINLVCLLPVLAASALIDRENPHATYSFQEYLNDFGKTYETAEASLREATFLRNLELIRQQNSAAGETWKAGVNEFTDWTTDEFKARRTGTTQHAAVLAQKASAVKAYADLGASALPDSIDWREKNVVTPPKNQGGCGSCWAFSATETLESGIAIATGKLLTLSPQQIVSCAPNPDQCGGTGGCAGSVQQLGFAYVQGVGITTEADYPYQGVTGTCDTTKVKPVASITGFVTVQPNNYTALLAAIATQGPISITVAAGGIGWQLYSSGVYSGGITKNCGFTLDHGVQVVGYGTDSASNKDYWLVRNSWGQGWGEQGYMRLVRFGEGKEPCGVDTAPADGIACKGNTTHVTYCGECGILSSSSYVTGAHLVS